MRIILLIGLLIGWYGYCFMCGAWYGHRENCPWNGRSQEYMRQPRDYTPGSSHMVPNNVDRAERYQHQTGK